jgi:hypothetical protein
MIYYSRKGRPIALGTWAAMVEDGNYKRVAETRTDNGYVSTVWLGLDHSYGRGKNPIIFETMVFGGPLDREQERYCTEEEALKGHEAMVARCINGGPRKGPTGPTTRIVEI